MLNYTHSQEHYVLFWVKYEYQKLQLGLCNRQDIFQEKMNNFFNGLDYVRPYIDDVLIISNKSLEYHIKKLDKVQSKLTYCTVGTGRVCI